jgi:restriction endonuclease S subunit
MKTKLPEGWKEIELGEVLDYEQPTKYIVKSTKYNDQFKTPVLTAGKSFIKGYTNETEGIREDLPVIIFDDFTTASQFVTFPFKVKSSAMKILTTKRKDVNLKYIFYLMQTIKFDSKTHKRYYLSKYQNLNIPLPPIETQEAIVSLLEKAEKAKELRNEADELSKDYLKSVFVDMFERGKFKEVEIKDVCENLFAGGDVPKNNFSKEKTDNYTVPIYSNGIAEKSIYGYTDLKKVEKDSVTISARGTIGNPTVRKAPFYPIIRLIVATPNNKIIKLDYLRFAISLFKFNKGGAAIPQLTIPMIKSKKIPLPTIELQNKFAEIVKQVESMKEHQKESREQIDDLFNALMQKAFKGELKC